EEDLLHLERSGEGLDQRGRLGGPAPDAQRLLREGEDVVPETGLEVALHLGKIEIRGGPPRDEILCVVKEEQAEVDEARRRVFAVDPDMPFRAMPPELPDQARSAHAV